MSPAFDLHCHSTASDGELTPTALVAYAAERGLETLALTDHDTIDGVEEARAAGERIGLEIITGLELAARYPGGNATSSCGSPTPARTRSWSTSPRSATRGASAHGRW